MVLVVQAVLSVLAVMVGGGGGGGGQNVIFLKLKALNF